MIPFYYGCIIVGPSGVGKSTLCEGLKQMMEGLERNTIIINLDPANYNNEQCDINMMELISVEDVMKELNLGYQYNIGRPNASLIYCFNFLLENIEWLYDKILKFKDHYLIFDFPGQIELYMNHDSIKKIISQMMDKHNQQLQISLTMIQLFDCLNCYQDNHFISACILSICMQMNMELPSISVLSKLDLIKQYGEMPMSLEYYLEADNLQHMLNIGKNNNKFIEKYGLFSNNLAKLIDEQGKLNFEPLYVENKQLMIRLILKIDKSNGFYYLENQNKLYQQIQEEMGDEVDYFPTELIMQLESELFPDQFN